MSSLCVVARNKVDRSSLLVDNLWDMLDRRLLFQDRTEGDMHVLSEELCKLVMLGRVHGAFEMAFGVCTERSDTALCGKR